MSLTQKALGGFAWTALEKFGAQGIQFLVIIILARILTPSDFGLIAMLMIFFAIAQNLIDSGFSQALIRENEITEEDKSTTFILNFVFAIIIYVALWFSAPSIAAFFEQPELVELTRFMGLALFFFSITVVQRATLTQELKFRDQAYIQLVASLITGIVAIILAYFDYGVWALAFKYVLIAFFSSIFYYLVNPWYPKSLINKKSFNKLFGFGSKLMVSGLINTTYNHIYKIIIGKFFTASILGFYTQANNFKNIFSKNIVDTLQKVTYPILSKTNDDERRLKNGYRKIIQVTSFFIFPAMFGLIMIAEPLILIMIGGNWLGTVPILQVLCLSGMLYHLNVINLNILKVIGRSDIYLKLAVLKKINITIAVVIGIQFGFWGLIIGEVVTSYIALFLNMYYTSGYLNYSIKEQISDILPVAFLSLPMTIVLWSFNLFSYSNSYIELITLIVVGSTVYILTNIIIKSQYLYMIIEIIKLNGISIEKIINKLH